MFPQIFGKYVLEREIAAGGMARVFLATLRGAGGFEKRLVVKQIRPELASDQSFISRFVAEAKTAVELSHANIVPVYELGEEQGTYYIAMEFCEGVPLNQLLFDGALTPAEGAYVGVEICRALDYAHRKAGIVHRDVTPRNVMVDPEGMVRLIDFGIAGPVDTAAQGGEPLFGSPGHMPPEQLRRGPLTPAADVFAVAALLVELWTGRAPFRRDTFEASSRALSEPQPDLGASTPLLASLGPLITQALAHEPRARPQSAEELARPLREFLRQSDLGDIARRLGQRVSERMTRPTEPLLPRVKLDRGLRATGSGATRTFAMRDALREWTAKIESDPPALVDAALHDSRPAGSVGWPPSSDSGSGSFRDLDPPRASTRRRLGIPALLATLLVGAGWAGMRTLPTRAASASGSVSAGVRPAVSAPASLLAPSSATTSALATLPSASAVPAPSAAVPPEPSPRRAALPAPHPASAERKTREGGSTLARTRIQITAEPPALVRVDSMLLGRTPVLDFDVTPGPHEFTFESDQLGERLEAKLNLEASGHRRVHADFTSATPRVYLR